MSTFEAIGFNVGVGSVFCVAALFGFNTAVQYKFNGPLAPRTYARPRNVIKNVLKGQPYGLRWIPWAYSLTYLEMMEGIPGTGTRRDGWSGASLRCNLDGVILLRFHSLCLKVTVLATILCLGIVLPVNMTAPCNPDLLGAQVCLNMTSLTDFENTTLAHIPQLSLPNEPPLNGFGDFFGRAFRGAPGLTMRLFTIVFVAFAIYAYTCVLIWRQWIQNLALRRVYYLEYNHYKGRKAELEFLENLADQEDPLQDRPSFIPQPELRDTVPNIGLYSVLYKLPPHHFSRIASATSSQVGRQLNSAVDFFDRVVPNQPGYSSSVAAVTILPDVNQVSRAWKKWFACASKLRRLRFIRKRLRKLQEGQEQQVQLVFESRSTSPDTAASKVAQTEGSGMVEQVGVQAEPPMADYPEQLPSTTDISRSDSKPQTGGILSAPLGFGSVREKIRNAALPPRSATSRGILETVDEGSSSDSSSDFFGPAGPKNEIKHKSQTDKTMCMSHMSERDTDSDSLKRATSGDSSEYSRDFEDPRDVTYQLDADRRSQGPKGTSNASYASNTSFENSDGRNLASSPRRSTTQKDRFLSSVGIQEESKLVNFLSDDEIEQLTVYCREFARSSAACCPYGCNEAAILLADVTTLAEMEQEAEEALQIANEELSQARLVVHRCEQGQEKVWFNFKPEATDSSFVERRKLSTGVESFDRESKCDENSNADLSLIETMQFGGNIKPNKMSTLTEHWAEAERLVQNERSRPGLGGLRWHRTLSTGNWSIPFKKTSTVVEGASAVARNFTGRVASEIIDNDSYAVVTFTSRQAAIAARQCMADGSGIDRWREVEAIPIPPLADAPPWNICDCRGCCRPVTVTLPQAQKRWRNNCVILFVVLFCFLYTIPLTAATTLLSPQALSRAFPSAQNIEKISGFLSGLLKTIFFAVCPQIFKVLANFGSEAASCEQAERRALRYFWFFMLATAFTGTSLATVVIEGLVYSIDVGGQAQALLRTVASTVPTTISAQWLNWIIFRIGITMPYNYLLQFNTFLFTALGWKCCARATAGGGPGGAPPYRIHVDCGVIFLCVVGLAPACPLIAPAALVCYLLFIPMLRWLVIFTYRPQFDGGGMRWPLLHYMLISSMIWSQIVLAAMMAMKKAYGAALLAGLAVIPTFHFDVVCKDRFLASYKDSGLLQTSELDGWNIDEETSMSEREDFRKFLVDCHKASYVPICVNGEENFLTAEPAVVIPTERDDLESGIFQDMDRMESPYRPATIEVSSLTGGRQRAETFDSFSSWRSVNSQQNGAIFRRVVSSNTAPQIPSPSGISGSANVSSTYRSISGGSNVSFQHPLVDKIPETGRGYRGEKSI